MIIKVVNDTRKESNRMTKKAIEMAEGKRPLKKAEKTFIMTPEMFAKLFTPQRLRLLNHLQSYPDQSIYKIAKDLDRKYEAVHRDISFLLEEGLVQKKKEDRRCLISLKGPIRLEMAG